MVAKRPILTEKLIEEQQKEFEKLEKKIDDHLYREYFGEKVYVHVKHIPHPEVMKRLIKVYEEEDWTIKLEYGFCPRNGDSWCWIEIS